jgi:hypothetical protein
MFAGSQPTTLIGRHPAESSHEGARRDGSPKYGPESVTAVNSRYKATQTVLFREARLLPQRATLDQHER